MRGHTPNRKSLTYWVLLMSSFLRQASTVTQHTVSMINLISEELIHCQHQLLSKLWAVFALKSITIIKNLWVTKKVNLKWNHFSVTEFKLHDRAYHVFSEAGRVEKFKQICDTAPADSAVQLGKLMSASHLSTQNSYECSHPDLDTLVQICLWVNIPNITSKLWSLTVIMWMVKYWLNLHVQTAGILWNFTAMSFITI